MNIRINPSVTPEGLSEAFELLAERLMINRAFAVIHLDLIEAFAPDRTATTSELNKRRLTNMCAEWLTEFTQVTDAFVLATSNFPMKADSRVINKFTQLFVPPPDAKGMAEVWRHQFESAGNNIGPLDYEPLGDHSEGYTPQEINERIIPKLRQTVTESVVDGEDITVDTELVLTHLDETAPVTVPEYVTEVAQTTGIKRFPQLCEYIQIQSGTDISI